MQREKDFTMLPCHEYCIRPGVFHCVCLAELWKTSGGCVGVGTDTNSLKVFFVTFLCSNTVQFC